MLTNQRFARSTALFISLITLSFLLMTFDVRSEGTGVVGTLRDGVRTLFDPVQSAVTAGVRPGCAPRTIVFVSSSKMPIASWPRPRASGPRTRCCANCSNSSCPASFSPR